MFLFYDPYFLLLIPAFILAMYAQARVKKVYGRYSKVPCRSGYTGAEAARDILDKNGLQDVPIEETKGVLSDHYDPVHKVLRLSPGVYEGRSVASVGVAAHETGHAIQHARMYLPLILRSSVVPAANFSSRLAMPLFFIGFLFNHPALMDLGIMVFICVVAFQVITLPVEFNASWRAVRLLHSEGIVSSAETGDVRKVLNAAALTYLAAAAVSLLHLIRLILLRQGRR